MAKKKVATKSSPPSPSDEAGAQEVQSLREEANKHFARKEYQKALETYEKALKLVPEGSNERALVHSNKGACFMMLKRYKEAVNECGAALDCQPGYYKALVRRAKAYEHMGHYKQALSDIHKANQSEQATAESQEVEKRLRDILSGKKPAAPANGVARKATATKRQPGQMVFQAKCTLDDEVRMIHLTNQTTYAELLEMVKFKFPNCGPVMLKYLDRQGDLVTITDRNDIHKGLTEAVEQMQRDAGGAHGPRLAGATTPPLRITVVRAKSEADVPRAPPEETQMVEQMLQARRMLQAQALAAQKTQKEEPQQMEQAWEPEQWLADFAMLFRDYTGIDTDRPIDLYQQGWDKLNEAMEATIAHEKALPLFDQAAERFQETAAMGMQQWGNVYMAIARKYMEEHQEGWADKAEAELQRAEGKFRESLGIKADFFDAAVALASVHFERAKISAKFATVKPPKDEGKEADAQADKGEAAKEGEAAAKPAAPAKAQTPEEQQASVEEQQKHNQELVNAALAKLQAADVEAAEQHFQLAAAKYEEVIKMLPKEELEKEIKPQPAASVAQTQDPPPEEDINLYAQALIMWGNMLYEMSQMRGAVGGDWRPLLDEACDKFRTAGCHALDIRQACATHIKKDEIELGPEPEADAPAPQKEAKEPPVAEKVAEKPAASDVKGLPSLGPKPKKKAEAAA